MGGAPCRCATPCGLDVHKKKVVACLRTPGQHAQRQSELRTFATTTPRALTQLADWLVTSGCTHAAMESTGIYWRLVHQILEERQLSLVLVNAAHVKKVPVARPT
jgi:transposase